MTLMGLLGAAGAWGHAAQPSKAREMKLSITEAGFVPSSIEVHRGTAVLLLITRKTEKTCATQATFPSMGKTYDTPLNKVVRVELPAVDGHANPRVFDATYPASRTGPIQDARTRPRGPASLQEDQKAGRSPRKSGRMMDMSAFG